ncbi:MFS-type transporter SLC18B1-like isoform X2 [Lycorma delicatula]|uniref:MFS-type transporter SLC18B1-like isoform X2 n=1 Tax=Lycorma delicatula TaxID=130591 RepID=UPI003F511925
MTFLEDSLEYSTLNKHTNANGPILGDDMAPKFTKRQWLTLFAIGSVHFSSAICISLQAPFYPQEAESKNATATEYGLVFGSFEFVAFLSSPLLGKHIDSVGAKLMLNIGMVIASLSAILFGMLDYINDHNTFISLSFLLRMSESLGSTAALVAAFSITAAVFPDSVATTFATLEVFYGVGYIVGPTLGGLFFSIGGYKLPFVINGSAMLLLCFVVYLCLPHIDRADSLHKKEASIFNILRVPAVLLNSVSCVATSISMGYYAATLEPHLRQFGLSPIAMGMMFIISGGTYALIAPIVGRLCDRWIYPKRVIAVGCLLITTSYIIVGPAPFLPIPTTLPLCIIGLVVHGFGLASMMVPTFIDSICSAVDAGFDDDISTYGLLSGLWSSSFALGAFVGPSVAGVLYDTVGFRNGTLFVIIIHVLLFISIVSFIIFEKKRTIPPKRIRLLSERPEEPNGSNSTEREDLKGGYSKSSYVDLVQHWNTTKQNTAKVNGYGSISKSIDYIS